MTKQTTDQASEAPAAVEAEEERLHPLLSNEEVKAVRAKARKEIEAEKKKAASADLLTQEKRRLEIEEGLHTGTAEDELVNILIDVPDFVPFITFNGRPYWPGAIYTVPRHVARSLNEAMWRSVRHQALEVEGKKLGEFYRTKRSTVISGKLGVVNAPQSVA